MVPSAVRNLITLSLRRTNRQLISRREDETSFLRFALTERHQVADLGRDVALREEQQDPPRVDDADAAGRVEPDALGFAYAGDAASERRLEREGLGAVRRRADS